MDVIFDLDGTLFDCEHRRHFIATKPKNYKAFQKAANLDPVILPIANVARSLSASGHRIVYCTGREDSMRSLTGEMLRIHNLPSGPVYMRPPHDFRPDFVVKKELLEKIKTDGYDPMLVFDDRKRVVDMWREEGILCAQVAAGDY